MIEPNNLTIPPKYASMVQHIKKGVTFTQKTDSNSINVIEWFSEVLSGTDFVVVKFDDTDICIRGQTLEYAFVEHMMKKQLFQLVDGFFIELHSWYPDI